MQRPLRPSAEWASSPGSWPASELLSRSEPSSGAASSAASSPAATLLFAAGLIDDLRHLSPIVKLAAQVGAAVIALASGLHVEIVENEVLAWGIGILWLVGISNAFNLLDNMDGLAATLAAIACAYFAIDALTEHPSETVLVLSLALGLACAAFLPFNLRPGRSAAVFMGDSGSLVLGFALASFALASSWTVAGTTVATVLLPLLILAIPILDTTFVTLVRLGQRRPVSQGGRDHTSHRLVYYGLSEANAVLLLALVAAAIGATALAYNVLDNARLTAFGVLLTFVLLVQFGSFLSDLEERSRRGEAAEEVSLWKALVFEPRRLVEVVVDFVVICATFLAAYLLVIGGLGSEFERSVFLAALPILLATRYVAFVALGVYRRVWRFATARDAIPIALGCAASAVVAFLVLVALRDIGPFPAFEVFVVDAVLCTLLVGASRLTLRLLPEARARAARPAAGARRRRRSSGARAGARAARRPGSSGRRLPRRQPSREASSDPRHHRGRRARRGPQGDCTARGRTRCSSRSLTRRRSDSMRSCARRRRLGFRAASSGASPSSPPPEQPVEVSLP